MRKRGIILLFVLMLVFGFSFPNIVTAWCVLGVGPSCGGGCFPAGTKILMEDNNYKNIEDVEVGDYVLSYDEIKKKNVYSKVLELESPLRLHMCELNFEEHSVKLTNRHPVYTKQGWKSIDPYETAKENPDLIVEKLSERDEVLFNNGKFLEIKNIDCWPEIVKTYNLKVIENTHTFYAGNILVHNKGPSDPQAGCYSTEEIIELDSAASSSGSLTYDTFFAYYRGGKGSLPGVCTGDDSIMKTCCDEVQCCDDENPDSDECEEETCPVKISPSTYNKCFEVDVWPGKLQGWCYGSKYLWGSDHDADQSEEACACIEGSAWNSGVWGSGPLGCCGDDTDDGIIPYAKDDPDLSEAFCTGCYLGDNGDDPDGSRSWDDSGQDLRCCGDDADLDLDENDCDANFGNYFCTNETGGTWNWYAASGDMLGEILLSNCSGKSYLATGDQNQEWLLCDAENSKFETIIEKTANNIEYPNDLVPVNNPETGRTEQKEIKRNRPRAQLQADARCVGSGPSDDDNEGGDGDGDGDGDDFTGVTSDDQADHHDETSGGDGGGGGGSGGDGDNSAGGEVCGGPCA